MNNKPACSSLAKLFSNSGRGWPALPGPVVPAELLGAEACEVCVECKSCNEGKPWKSYGEVNGDAFIYTCAREFSELLECMLSLCLVTSIFFGPALNNWPHSDTVEVQLFSSCTVTALVQFRVLWCWLILLFQNTEVTAFLPSYIICLAAVSSPLLLPEVGLSHSWRPALSLLDRPRTSNVREFFSAACNL